MLGHLYLENPQSARSIGSAIDKLDSWKQIASFFGREVRTVQLWEKSEGLPIWRHHHRKLGSVYAFRAELEAWQIASSRGRKYGALKDEPAGPVAVAPTSQARSPELVRMALAPFRCLNQPSESASSLRFTSDYARGFEEELAVEMGRLGIETVRLVFAETSTLQETTSQLRKNPIHQENGRAVLTGAIRCYRNRVRIVARILASEDLSCIWSERFDAPIADLLDSQSEMASRICASIPVKNLRPRLKPRQHSLPHRESAQEACMMGRFFWEQRNQASLDKALGYFKRAITIDSKCAEAYAGVADCYVALSYSQLTPPKVAMHKANRAVESLLGLNIGSAEARNCLANITLNFRWDWAEAERQCSIACEAYPDNSRGLQLYSILMATQGRHHEAIDIALHALQKEPLSKVLSNEVAYAFYYAGDYKSAISFVRRAVELDPEFVMGYALLGLTEMALNNWDEAFTALSTGARLTKHSPQFKSLLAYAYARQGQTTQAMNLLTQVENNVPSELIPAFNIAAARLAMNEKDKALQNLRYAHAQRDLQMICLKSDPRFATLQSNMFFKDIVASIFPS